MRSNMSMTVRCDQPRCQRSLFVSVSAAASDVETWDEVRTYIESQGWQPGGIRDYCPEHAECETT